VISTLVKRLLTKCGTRGKAANNIGCYFILLQ
jgi:hypothetical protein